MLNDETGRLTAIHGKGGGARLDIRYDESRISQVITSAGYVLSYRYEDSRIVEIRDETGRRCTKRYIVYLDGVGMFQFIAQGYEVIEDE